MRATWRWLSGLCIGTLGGVALALAINGEPGTGTAAAAPAPVPAVPAIAETRVVPTAGQLQLSYAPVTRRAAPAVVNIYTQQVVRTAGQMAADPFFRQFLGGGVPQPRVAQSLGSGVIVSPEGLVVTNNHVVAKADKILVVLADRREYAAKLVFADPRSDLALLRLEAVTGTLPSAVIGDSDRAEVGDIVLAIGNPFGFGQTVTSGIVSAIARTGAGVSDYQFFLQTDAAINPGNSGGALVNLRGEIVGINTAIFSRSGENNGIGFAIPSNMVRIFVASAGKGKFVTGWIGAEGEAVTAGSAKAAGLDRPAGVLVTSVTQGSPAAAAGIRPGDIIAAIDGKDVADPGMLRYRIATQTVGQTVDTTLIRDGAKLSVPLRLAAPPENPPRALTRLDGNNLLNGVTIGNLSPAFAQEIGAGLPEQGVVVVAVAANTPAARFGYLRPGDLIEAVNGAPVASVADARTAVARGAPSVRVNRGGDRAECGVSSVGGLVCRS